MTQPSTANETTGRYLTEYKLRMEKVATVEGFNEQWKNAADAVALCQHVIQDADREHLIAVAVGPDGRPMGLHTVSIGTLTASMAHPRECFRFALECPCSAVLIAHNHPTIDVTPSRPDIEATLRFRDVGALIGIPLFGSLIIGRDGHWTDILQHIKDKGKDRKPYWDGPVPQDSPDGTQDEPDSTEDEPDGQDTEDTEDSEDGEQDGTDEQDEQDGQDEPDTGQDSEQDEPDVDGQQQQDEPGQDEGTDTDEQQDEGTEPGQDEPEDGTEDGIEDTEDGTNITANHSTEDSTDKALQAFMQGR